MNNYLHFPHLFLSTSGSPEEFGNVTFLPPPDFSGTFDLQIRGVVRDETSDGDVATNSTPFVSIPVEVNPVADCVEFNFSSTVVVEDEQSAPNASSRSLGFIIEQGLTILDDGTENPAPFVDPVTGTTTQGGENNAEVEYISRIVLTVVDDSVAGDGFDNLRFNVDDSNIPIFNDTDVSEDMLGPFMSGIVEFNATTNTVTITSSKFEDARTALTLGSLSEIDRSEAQRDILAVARLLEVFGREDESDENEFVRVEVTSIDINSELGRFDETSCSDDVEVIVQAFADDPLVMIEFQPPTNTFTEDDDNFTQSFEATGGIPLFVNFMASVDDVDDSETLTVEITIPFEPGFDDPIGTLSSTLPNNIDLVFAEDRVEQNGDVVYTITADESLSASEQAFQLNRFFQGDGTTASTAGLFFTPATNFAGNLTGTAGIRVDLIATEKETDPSEIARKRAVSTDFVNIDILPQVREAKCWFIPCC